LASHGFIPFSGKLLHPFPDELYERRISIKYDRVKKKKERIIGSLLNENARKAKT
jgi:hypothetical protein